MDHIELLKNLIRDLNRLVVTIKSNHPMDMFDDDGKPMAELKSHVERAEAELKELEEIKASLVERETWIYEIAGRHEQYLITLAKAAKALHCDTCGGSPVLRRRKSDGVPFFGCSGYPDCKSSFRMADVEEKLKSNFLQWIKFEETKAEFPAPPGQDAPNDEMRQQLLDLCREMRVSPEHYIVMRKDLVKKGFETEREITREMIFNLIQEKTRKRSGATGEPGGTS
jgi:ssDNA-binding Zn-finger/Zn-ribbon topoisomerase 1